MKRARQILFQRLGVCVARRRDPGLPLPQYRAGGAVHGDLFRQGVVTAQDLSQRLRILPQGVQRLLHGLGAVINPIAEILIKPVQGVPEIRAAMQNREFLQQSFQARRRVALNFLHQRQPAQHDAS